MHGKALTLANLPEDPPPVDGLKTVPIRKGDYRKGLISKQVTHALYFSDLPAHRQSQRGGCWGFNAVPALFE